MEHSIQIELNESALEDYTIKKFNAISFVISIFFAGSMLLVLTGMAGAATIKYVATDGSGDYNVNGTNDEVKINLAISDVSAISTPTNRGIVHLKAGVYKIKNEVITKANVILEGEYDNTVIQLQPGAPLVNGTALVSVHGSYSIVRNLKIDGNKYNISIPRGEGYWNGLHVNSPNTLLQNLTIINIHNDGILAYGQDLTIKNITIIYAGHSAVSVGGGSNFFIQDIFNDGPILANVNAVIRLTNVKNGVVRDVTAKRTGNFVIEIWQFASYYFTENITFENITSNQSTTMETGIVLNSYGHTDQNWHINNITFKNVIIDSEGVDTGWDSSAPEGLNPAGVNINNANNVVFDNAGIYDSQGDGIYVKNNLQGSKPAYITVRNSAIVKSTGYAFRNGEGGGPINWKIDYNDIFNHPSGNFGSGISAGTGNIYVDPLFANPTASDFHLKSQYGRWTPSGWVTDTVTSPLIDAGDPASDYSKELMPSGGRINMGAYGNTPHASKSAAGNITGTVKDISNNPISGATVTASGLSAQTDVNGTYLLVYVPTGNQRVTASKQGYVAQTQSASVVEDSTIALDFALAPAVLSAITSWGNNKTDNNILILTVNTSEAVKFNATANQTITIWNWYKDDVNQNNNFDNFTTSWSNGGTKTIKVDASNSNGTSNTVVWNVNVDAGPSFIFFTDPTPGNGTTISQNYAYINTTISDPNTTAFIDWSRSSVGWWRFNNESGENSAFFKDWSSYGNDGTCSGTSCPASTSGKFGNALNFDGSDDYVTLPDSASLNPSNITVEAWFNAVSGTLAYQKSVVQKPYTSHTYPYYQYMLSLVDNGGDYPKEADFYITIDGLLYDVGANNLSFDYGEWHYLAGTYNGTDAALYLDGALVATQSVSGIINSYNTGLQIGAYPNLGKTSTYVFGGKIDEVRIHNRGLSPDEIKASYNAGIYRLYGNFANLAKEVYNYKAYAQNFSGDVNQTETRILTRTMEPLPIAPAITSWGNNKTSNNSLTLTVNTSEAVRFNATANQTITTWNWYKDDVNQNNNFDNLNTSWSSGGTKTVKLNASNSNGTSNTVTWTVTVISPPPANITSWGNNKTSNNSLTLTVNTSEAVRFNATANQTITAWNWYKDDVNQNNNFDNFTTSWSNGGTKTVKVNASNNNGTSNTVIWNVNVNAGPSFIFFTDPTPANGTTITQNYAYINTTISDPNTTAFIDWSRSLTGWWGFNNESGENSAFFRDWSSYGNDGTCSGISCPTSTSGKFGNALDFDGSNDYVTMPDSASLNPSNITVEAWFNAVSGTLSDQKSIVQKPYTSHAYPYYQYMLGLIDNGGAYPKEADFYITIDGLLYQVSAINLNFGYGEWHYLAGTYNGADAALYLDGVLVATQPVTGTINSYNTDLQIGAYQNLGKTSTYVFGGKIDEVRIHNRGLSPDEIKASYNAGIYRLYRNFTNLAGGVYNYKAYAQNFSGDVDQTETRILTRTTGSLPIAPAITSWGNNKTNNNSLTLRVNTSEAVRFNATANQTITTWNWYKDDANQSNNFDNLTISWSSGGTNTVKLNASNSNGTSNTVTWTVTVISPPPAITTWGYNKTGNDSLTLTVNTSEAVRFNATANQTITAWNWYKDDANQNNNFDNFTTSWSSGGTKTVKVNATNSNGTSNTVIWNVNAAPLFIYFTDPTPANGTTITQSYAYINTTISDPNTTAFIDWNRSSIGWWRFNNEGGENSAFFRDLSSYGNNGSCSGTSCPASTSGKFGNALNFDGSDDYVTVPNSASLNPSYITVEAWFNAVSGTLAYQKSIVQKPYTSHAYPYYQYMLGLIDNGGAYPKEADFSITINGVLYHVGANNLNYSYGEWHYLAGTYNSANVALYLDGVLVAKQSVYGTINSYNTVLQIGAYPNLGKTSTYVFGGKIDEVRIHNRGLSPDEIKASYNAGIYRLYGNFTNLADGVYNYKAYAQNYLGDVDQTETRILTRTTGSVPIAPAITSWGNNKTNNNSLSLKVNTSEAVRFNVTANQTITTWNWYKDDVNQSNNFDNLTASWTSGGTKTIKVNATKSNGTSNTVTWTVTVISSPSANITSWGNNKTSNDSLTLTVNMSEAVRFNATANQTITTWNWYKDDVNQNNNFDNLTTSWTSGGTKTIKVNATNSNGSSNTVTWTVTVNSTPSANITSWGNNKTSNDSLNLTVNTSEAVRFNATANQTITTWNWYKDDVNQNNNFDNLTTSWYNSGTKTVKVRATNSNGTSNTVTWTVNVNAGSSFIYFTDPTPANGTTITQNYAYINTTISDPNTTAFIDWNRSITGWWRFNNEGGENSAFFRDWSTWGNDGTCSGTSCPASTSGKFGKALDFDGSDDYVTVPNSSSLNPSNITVEAWFNAVSGTLAYQKSIVQKPYTSHTYPYYQYMLLLVDSDASPKEADFIININGVLYQIGAINLNYGYGQWHYLAGTYNSANVALYLDGVLVAKQSVYGTINSYNTDLQIGAYPNLGKTSTYVFNGKIDEVRIHNRALSREEIKASYNAGIYRLYRNFTNLADGVYNYKAYAQNFSGDVNQTETRILTVSTP